MPRAALSKTSKAVALRLRPALQVAVDVAAAGKTAIERPRNERKQGPLALEATSGSLLVN